MKPSSIQVEAFRDNAGVERVRPVWESLQNHPNTDIDFYQTILRERPEILRPHVMLASNQGSPEVLLIGRLERQHMSFKLGYLKLLEQKAMVVALPLGGLLGGVKEEHCEGLLQEILRLLRDREADMVSFSHLKIDDLMFTYLRAHLPWYRHCAYTGQKHRAMTIPDSVDAFYASLSAKTRKHFRQNAKKLNTDFPGQVKIKIYTTAAELPLLLEAVEAIAPKTWQRGLGVGLEMNQEMMSRFKLQAERGWLHGSVLYLADKPCAYWLGTAYQGTLHSDFLGYDPVFSKHAPGMYLIATVIEGYCKPKEPGRLALIDFGLGDALYKQQLGSIEWTEASLQVYATSFKGLTLVFLTKSLGLIDRVVRTILEKTNLRDRVKSLWRKTARPTAATAESGAGKTDS